MDNENINEVKKLLEEVKDLLALSQRDFPRFVNSVDKDANSMKNSADYLKNSVNTFNNYMDNNIIDIELRNYLDILNNPELMNKLNIKEELLILKISNLLDRKGMLFPYNNKLELNNFDNNKVMIKKNKIS